MSLLNEKNLDCRFNFTFHLFKDIYLSIAYISLNIQDYDGDANYQKEIFKTTFNASKLMAGITGNFMTKILIDQVRETADFELKMPMKKVRTLNSPQSLK